GRLALVELGVLGDAAVGVAHAPSYTPDVALAAFGMGGAERPPAPARLRRGGGLGRLSPARAAARGGGGRSLGSGQGSPSGAPPLAGQSSLPSGAAGVGEAGCSRMIRSLSAFHFFSMSASSDSRIILSTPLRKWRAMPRARPTKLPIARITRGKSFGPITTRATTAMTSNSWESIPNMAPFPPGQPRLGLVAIGLGRRLSRC